jgi:hypothetical protein
VLSRELRHTIAKTVGVASARTSGEQSAVS